MGGRRSRTHLRALRTRRARLHALDTAARIAAQVKTARIAAQVKTAQVQSPANAADSVATLDGRRFQSTAVLGNAAERELMDGTRIWLRFDEASSPPKPPATP